MKIFICGAQRTWDTACGQHVRAYKCIKENSKKSRLNLILVGGRRASL